MSLPDGFIAHDGGPCPVPLTERVDVVFRDGFDVTGCQGVAGSWGDLWIWPTSRYGPADIIAYRPTSSAGSE
mgnify:CR=1 FL=1